MSTVVFYYTSLCIFASVVLVHVSTSHSWVFALLHLNHSSEDTDMMENFEPHNCLHFYDIFECVLR